LIEGLSGASKQHAQHAQRDSRQVPTPRIRTGRWTLDRDPHRRSNTQHGNAPITDEHRPVGPSEGDCFWMGCTLRTIKANPTNCEDPPRPTPRSSSGIRRRHRFCAVRVAASHLGDSRVSGSTFRHPYRAGQIHHCHADRGDSRSRRSTGVPETRWTMTWARFWNRYRRRSTALASKFFLNARGRCRLPTYTRRTPTVRLSKPTTWVP